MSLGIWIIPPKILLKVVNLFSWSHHNHNIFRILGSLTRRKSGGLPHEGSGRDHNIEWLSSFWRKMPNLWARWWKTKRWRHMKSTSLYKAIFFGTSHSNFQISFSFRSSVMTASLKLSVFARYAQPRHRCYVGPSPRASAQHIQNKHTHNGSKLKDPCTL